MDIDPDEFFRKATLRILQSWIRTDHLREDVSLLVMRVLVRSGTRPDFKPWPGAYIR